MNVEVDFDTDVPADEREYCVDWIVTDDCWLAGARSLPAVLADFEPDD